MIKLNCCLESHYRKDDSTGKNGCKEICQADKNGILLYVVLHGVVAGKCNQTSKCQTKREKDLGSCIKPAVNAHKLIHLQERHRWGCYKANQERLKNVCLLCLEGSHRIVKLCPDYSDFELINEKIPNISTKECYFFCTYWFII